MDFSLMVVLQQMEMLRVVTRLQVDISLVVENARPCRQNTPRLGGNANYTLERREVRMIFRRPHKVRDSRRVRDRYSQKAKKPPQTVHTTRSKPPSDYVPQLDDIVFTQGDTSLVHHPHKDAIVIIVEVANSIVHRLLIDSGSTVNILTGPLTRRQV